MHIRQMGGVSTAYIDGYQLNFDNPATLAHLQNTGFDLGLDYSALSFDDSTTRTIVTLGWEIDEKQSLSARFIQRDEDSNFSLAYSSSGFSGAEWFVIVGDPNSREWRNRVAVKLVWPF